MNRDGPDASDCDVREGRVEVLRSGLRGRTPSKRRRAMEGPSARTHGAMPERREPRRQAGPNRSPWFPPFAETKGAAVKAEPVEPAHTDNGYVRRERFYPRKIRFNSWSCVFFDESEFIREAISRMNPLPRSGRYQNSTRLRMVPLTCCSFSCARSEYSASTSITT